MPRGSIIALHEGQAKEVYWEARDDTLSFDNKGQQRTNKEYLGKVWRQFKKRYCYKKSELFPSGQWHLHQSNAHAHYFILATNLLTRMDIEIVSRPPRSAEFAPFDF